MNREHMPGKPLGVAVIGVGSIGKHHARILSGMRDVDLIGLVDSDPEAGRRAGLPHVPHYADLSALLHVCRPDAVVVATPTSTHASVARCALERGIAVLVEKPIALTLSDALDLVQRAAVADVVLAVGHVERFNPAVRELKRRIDGGELGMLFQVDVRRTGPFPDRITDAGVTVDLATHDLDVLDYLLGARPDILFAQVSRRIHATHEDLLSATLRYPPDTVATLQVNWLTPTKIRRLALTGERGMFVVDYLSQDLTWFENGVASGGWDALDTLRGVSEGRSIRYPIPHREPLAAELQAFVDAVQGHSRDVVSGWAGLKALALALSLLQSARSHEVIHNPLDSLAIAAE